MISNLRFSLWLCCLLGFTSLLTAQETYVIGNEDDNEYRSVRAFDGQLIAVGREFVGGTPFGVISAIDPNTGQVQWTNRMEIPSSFFDVAQGEEGFVVVGRSEPVNIGGVWQNNVSLLASFDLAGGFINSRTYNLDNDGGRESLNRILRNDNPADPNFPFYVLGIRDSDGNGWPAHTRDEVVMLTVNQNLDINLHLGYSSNVNFGTNDDEFIRSFELLNDGTGNMIMVGSNFRSGVVTPTIVIVSNQGVVQNAANFPANTLRIVWDVLVLPEREGFVFVGQDVNLGNFIIRTDITLTNIVYYHQIPEFPMINEIIELDNNYYVTIWNRTIGNDIFISRLENLGNQLQMGQMVRLTDDDTNFELPYILTQNNEIIYGDSRIIDLAGGNGTATGFGPQPDMLLAVMPPNLESCITEELEAVLELLETNIMEEAIFVRDLPVPELVPQIAFPIEHFSEENCEVICGEMFNTMPTFDCANGPTYTMTVQFQNNDPLLDVTGVYLTNITPANATVNPTFFSFIPPNQIPAGGGISAPQAFSITLAAPITVPTDICFDVIYFAGNDQCCLYEHCITLMPVDPCESVSATPTDLADCCHEIDLQNNFCEDYFTGITTELITPGVTFDNVTGAGWTSVVNGTSTSIDWDFNAGNGTLPLGFLPTMGFCLNGVTSQAQIPQQVVVHWLAIDPITGLEVIVCSDTLEFNCVPCLTIDGVLGCTTTPGVYTFNFTLVNTSTNTVTDIVLQSFTAGVVVTHAPFSGLNLLPGNTFTGTATFTDNNSPLLAPGTIIDFRAITIDTNPAVWCCHVDAQLVIPTCGIPKPGNPTGTVQAFSVGEVSSPDRIQQNAKALSGPEVFEILQLDRSAFPEEAAVINLYPVPASDYLMVDAALEGIIHVEFIHSDGRILKSVERDFYKGQAQQFDISTLPGGLYFARFTDAQGAVLQQRFVKASN